MVRKRQSAGSHPKHIWVKMGRVSMLDEILRTWAGDAKKLVWLQNRRAKEVADLDEAVKEFKATGKYISD